MSSILGPGRVRTEVIGPDGNPVTSSNPLPVRAPRLVFGESFEGNSDTTFVFSSPMRGVTISNEGNASLVLRVGGPRGLITLPDEEDWETGNLNGGDGSPTSSSTKIRTVDFVSVPNGAENLIGVVNPGFLINIFQFDADDVMVAGSSTMRESGYVWAVHQDATQFKLVLSYDPTNTTAMNASHLPAVNLRVGISEPPEITVKAGVVIGEEFAEFTHLSVESTVEFLGYVTGENHVD